MTWGIDPKTVDHPVALWWGIRAIFRSDGNYVVIDIVHDRQAFSSYDEATREDRVAICKWFDAKGEKLLEKALVAEHVTSCSNRLVTVSDGGFHIIATPRASHGYLYLGVWKDAACPTISPITSSTETPPASPKVKRSGLGSRRNSSASPRNSVTTIGGTRKGDG